jgi:hypothetical protein
MQSLKQQKGLAMMMIIVIISAAALIMAFSATWLGLGELETGYTSQKGNEAWAVAEGCVEETLRRLKIEADYSGGSLNLNNGSCIIEIAGAGSSKTITATSTVDQYNKVVEVQITLTNNIITINSWQEKEN